MGVRVQAGTMRIPSGTAPANFWYEAAIDTASPGEALTVTTANPSNPRRDYVVAYIDKGVTPSTAVTNNSNGVLKLAVVAGTAASSPSDPTGSQITTAIGASNPYIILARIAVGTGVTQITNSDITDLRTFMQVGAANIAPGAITLSTPAVITSTVPFSTETTVMTNTFTMPAGGRRAKVTIDAANIVGTAAGDRVRVQLKEGATILRTWYIGIAAPGWGGSLTYSLTPSAGSHTYTVTATKDIGTSTANWYADNLGGSSLLLIEAA